MILQKMFLTVIKSTDTKERKVFYLIS